MSSSSSSSFEIVGQTFSALALGVPFLSCRSASSFALSSLFPSIQVLVVESSWWSRRRRHHHRRATRTDEDNNGEKEGISASRAPRRAATARATPTASRRLIFRVTHLVVGVVTASLPFSKHHNNSHKTTDDDDVNDDVVVWKVVLLFFFFFFFFVVFVVVVSSSESRREVASMKLPLLLPFFFCSFPKP